MIGWRRWLAAAVLTLPGSCIAAPPDKPPPANPLLRPAASSSIGTFKLDRVPQQGGVAIGFAPLGTTRLVKDGEEVVFAPDGRFIIGFGRDHNSVAILSATLPGGRNVTERLSVATRTWHIESLATLPHHSQPDAEFETRRPTELAQINAARRLPVQSSGWRETFVWPVRGRVSGLFGSQRIYAGQPGAPHNGVDVAGAIGTAVTAPADGIVVLAAASPFTLEGNLLMIGHGMGLNSAFLHLSRIDVKVGDMVRRGQPIGAIGMTGRATGPHLHWGMKWHDERIDPAILAGPIR